MKVKGFGSERGGGEGAVGGGRGDREMWTGWSGGVG